ncbi:DUF397 domain-containing protein [Streptomyces sp. NPDC097107]|uniref:DUF397 domain-containing protein n=1 Tax=Streptomyces sp. NPDC097107 TaxID=3366089 RepID=UPI0037FC7496
MSGTDLKWFKSSYSGSEGGACVEVAIQPTTIHIRHSKTTVGDTITVEPAAWTAFLAW